MTIVKIVQNALLTMAGSYSEHPDRVVQPSDPFETRDLGNSTQGVVRRRKTLDFAVTSPSSS